MSFKTLLKNILLWRIGLFVLGFFAQFLLPLRPGYTLLTSQFKWADLFSMWANFDGLHYLTLAQHWYNHHETYHLYAFFPLYPGLINLFHFLGSYLTTGLILSHLFLLLALYYLYKLLRLDYSSDICCNTIYLLLIFPTSFFFGSVYTESLFLFLAVFCFYQMRQGNFLLAAFTAALASATRVAGIFLYPALLFEMYQFYGKKIGKLITPSNLTAMFLAPAGLLSYMRFQFQKTSDYFSFIHSQAAFGANRVTDKLILLHQVFFRYFKMIVFVENKLDPIFLTVTLEFLTGFIFLGLLIHGFKQMRLSYFVYCLLSYLFPTFTGTFSSLPRYVLVLFPAFAVLSQIHLGLGSRHRRIYNFVSLTFLILAVFIFTRGYFVG